MGVGLRNATPSSNTLAIFQGPSSESAVRSEHLLREHERTLIKTHLLRLGSVWQHVVLSLQNVSRLAYQLDHRTLC